MLCYRTPEGRIVFVTFINHSPHLSDVCTHCLDATIQVSSENEKCLYVYTSRIELSFSRYILSGKHYQDSLKGMICAKTNITQMIYDNKTKIELSNKPFLMLIILASILLGFVSYYFIVALKQRLT